jgi:short-chain dehydrogenase
MRDSNVRISTLCPGPTMTEFEKMEEISGIFNKMKTMSAKKVAEIAYRDFSRGKSVIIPGKLNKIAVFFGKFIPRNLALKIVKKIQEKK